MPHHLFIFIDINECTQSSHNCSHNARCQNTVGSFRCICNNGYTGNGTQCTGLCFLFSLPFNYIAYFYYVTDPISQILMNVFALHTTAIHKQDVKTQLEGLGVFAGVATQEMVSAAMVGSHSLKHQM